MPDLFDPTVDLLTDAQRFAQAVLPHVDAAYNLARWLCGDAQDADDIVQEACLRAFRLFGGFRGGDGRPWLLAIVRNTWFSECARRRQAHTQPWQDEADLPPPMTSPPTAPIPPPCWPGPTTCGACRPRWPACR